MRCRLYRNDLLSSCGEEVPARHWLLYGFQAESSFNAAEDFQFRVYLELAIQGVGVGCRV